MSEENFDDIFDSDEDIFSDDEEQVDSALFKDAKLEISDRLVRHIETELDETQPNFKHLQLSIIQNSEFEYFIRIKHQDHGFLNYFSLKLLKIKGVKLAAYKITDLESPRVLVQLDGSKDIKTVLKETISQMRIELKGLKNAIDKEIK